MADTPNNRRLLYLLQNDEARLAEILDLNYKTQNIAKIKALTPPCALCESFYDLNGLLRDKIKANAIAMYQRLGKTAPNNDWSLFFAKYEAHHIFPKSLLVPVIDEKNSW